MPNLADRLAEARRSAFVGRGAELGRFAALLRGGRAAVLYVHGPGGVGKTSLLRRFADLAAEAGRPTIWLDADEPDPAAAGAGAVLLADEVDGLEPWLRETVLPALAGDAVAVLAGRAGPSLAWRTDPGWRDLLAEIPLGNLGESDAATLLRRHGVPDGEWPGILGLTHGHPLALAMAIDVRERTGELTPPSGQAVITALAGRLAGAIADPDRRAALEACTQVRVTTEPILAALLGRPGAHELFAWLRELPIMAWSGAGLYPHDLAREALAAELRWRDPEQHEAVRRRAREHYLRGFEGAGPGRQQAILRDLAYLHREHPVLAAMLTPLLPGGDGALRVGPAAPGELPELRAMIEAREGAESAALFDHWRAAQPDAVQVVRDDGGAVAGLQVELRLDAATERQRAADPATAAAWEFLCRPAPPGPGEGVRYVRFWLDREHYQRASAVQLALALHLVQQALTTPRLAAHFLATAEPEELARPCAYADMPRVPEAGFTVGGRSYGVFGHDWRVRTPSAWLALLAGRAGTEVSDPAGPPPPESPDRAAFAEAVRAALRDLQRPDRLAAGVLAGSRLVGDRLGGAAREPEAAGRAVAAAIREAAEILKGSARDRGAYRALHHTYLQPAGTQARAAELLNLPASTYRRHLAAGLSRLTDLLWSQENR